MEDNYQQDDLNNQNLHNMAQQMEQQRIWYEYQFEPKKPRGNKGWIVLLIAAVIFIIVILSLVHYL
ncbi:MAG: hypothetical protein II527_03855 [Bacteroidales bacterium]|nr:hypothetical protein [Bacteroidales bacterium]MBQ1882700.1 hypothetical protein [Bacteroidales bacterium]MBQ2483237.1 hypothetical protein [Bacteroidales bacterium]MBQ2492448.1 hypothetical protein [Bacteroidales bacterium]MBQ4196643.1 hypothetical protein [Bacteroidales bacterium]